MKTRYSLLMTLFVSVVACGGSPAAPQPQPAPSPASLSFTVTPNPVPTAGVVLGCDGTPVPVKSWFYSISIRNTGSSDFAVASWATKAFLPGVPTPVTTLDNSSNGFLAVFRTTTVPANGSVVGSLCVGANSGADDVGVEFTFANAAGLAFTTPRITYLR